MSAVTSYSEFASRLPTTHDEDWRYTNLAPLVSLLKSRPSVGRPSTGRDVFDEMNASFAGEARRVHFTSTETVTVLHKSADIHHPRVHIVVAAGVQATFIERFEGEVFTNAQCEVTLQEGASLRYIKWQDEATSSFHLANIHVTQAARSKLDMTLLAFGAKLGRTDVRVTLAEETETHIKGLLLAGPGQTQDALTYMDHAKPHSTSKQLFKTVLTGDGKSAYDGHVRVAPDAQKTNAAQKNQNLLLSKDAYAVSKPHLEIYADDVKCAHGATSGQISAESLFYLRSRGISEHEAKQLLTLGFAAEVLPEELLEEAKQRVAAWLT